ncbi:MAG: lipoyl synthase [Planctomycetota bacterium]
MSARTQHPRRLPTWIKGRLPGGEQYAALKQRLRQLGLATVCEEARCPNLGECWSGGTATVMLLGEICTRGCRFCAVRTMKRPPAPDPDEPEHMAQLISEAGLRYVVLTMVDRDDLEDGGADHVARTIEGLHARVPELLVEALVGDFQGQPGPIARVIASAPAVFAHNVETVERLTPTVRDPRCGYRQSLDVLAEAKRQNPAGLTKTSLMLGLGETDAELEQTFADLREVGVEILTLGQYLRPSAKHLEVVEFVHPDRFEALERRARDHGFSYVASGAMVRSSYRAAELFVERRLRDTHPAGGS